MKDLFKHKELIYAIYREKSFSKAAQKLFISQPALSAMVKKIENEVGVPLFDRASKPITLTEAGKEYIGAVRQIRQVEESFANYLLSVNNMEAGSLGVGSNQLLSSVVLPRYISAFTQKYPNIRLSLMDANSTTLQNEIMTGRLDIVIDNTLPSPELFEKKLLTREQLLLAVPAHFTENRQAESFRLTYSDILEGRHKTDVVPPVPLELFRHVPFILMNRDNDTRSQTNAIFQEVGFTPRVLWEMDRLATLYAYVEVGTAASIVSDTLVCHIRGVHQENIYFYTLPTIHANRGIYASYKKHKYFSRVMSTFIDALGTLE